MTSDSSIGAVLARASERLSATSDSARLDAEILLAQALDVPRSYLVSHPDDTLDDAAQARFDQAVDKREQHVPIAYLVGEREFWSLTLMVSEATLVPRPETELIVELALAELKHDEQRRVVDFGAGSGAIGLAIARERPHCDVVLTDISRAALDVARENARQHDIHNVRFFEGSWADPVLGERFDLIVSNPPYVQENDPALLELRHEPRQALAAGRDGLEALKIIVRDAPSIAAPDAKLIIEHGAEQREDVRQLLEKQGYRTVQTHDDLAGLARVITAVVPASVG